MPRVHNWKNMSIDVKLYIMQVIWDIDLLQYLTVLSLHISPMSRTLPGNNQVETPQKRPLSTDWNQPEENSFGFYSELIEVCACVYVCICVCIHVCKCIYVYIDMCVCVCMFIEVAVVVTLVTKSGFCPKLLQKLNTSYSTMLYWWSSLKLELVQPSGRENP